MIEIDSKEELNDILEKNKEVLVLFYASWCPYCTRFVPFFDNKIQAFKFENVIHVLLNDNDNPLWDNFDIEAVPTIMFFEKAKVSKRLDGKLGRGLNEREFNVWIEGFKPT